MRGRQRAPTVCPDSVSDRPSMLRTHWATASRCNPTLTPERPPDGLLNFETCRKGNSGSSAFADIRY